MSKVVFHVDEADKVDLVIGNVRNFLTARPTSTVVIVVNGPAIMTLTTTVWEAMLTELPQVEIDACHNAMAGHQLTAADLPVTVTVVPAGVVRLAELQEQGYAYLKP